MCGASGDSAKAPAAADVKTGGVKRKGLPDLDGSDSFAKMTAKVRVPDAAGAKRQKEIDELARNYTEGYVKHVAPEDKPFLGAQPLLLRKPMIATEGETERVTAVACKTIAALIQKAGGVHIRLANVSRQSPLAKELLESAKDDVADVDHEPLVVSLTRDSWHTMPFTELPAAPGTAKRLLVYVGTPGKYLTMCLKSYRGRFDTAYAENRLIVLTRGACMLPLGTQEQNIFGVDEEKVLRTIVHAVNAKGQLCWGHGQGSKAPIMTRLFGYPQGGALPPPLSYEGDAGGSVHSLDYMLDFLRYTNKVKIAKPELPVVNYYDTGLTVSVLMGSAVEAKISLLTDQDGLSMLRDASIGHTMSKMNQLLCVEPYRSQRGVYNFFIGDGASRLNGGVELALHMMDNHKAQSLTTMFVFNNYKWAIEDNLVADTAEEHRLYNKDFYGLLNAHENVVVCENALELRQTLALLSRKTDAYVQGKTGPGLYIVVVRGVDMELPPVIGDIEPILKSSEMTFLRNVLGKFAEGCQHKIPLYGCSAFEYIQYLHLFTEKMPEGKKYQYVCGRTDIQAAHMCGMQQPEGKCVLFINDVYGINSLGESLRSVLSGFGGKQLLIMIWHPSLTKIIDHFHLHRPPMVWPNLGPQLCKYYVRKESDAVFVDFAGPSSATRVTGQVNDALSGGVPLVVVNVLPEQERSYISLDIRVKTG